MEERYELVVGRSHKVESSKTTLGGVNRDAPHGLEC
jgi:hypothetical protein